MSQNPSEEAVAAEGARQGAPVREKYILATLRKSFKRSTPPSECRRLRVRSMRRRTRGTICLNCTRPLSAIPGALWNSKFLRGSFYIYTCMRRGLAITLAHARARWVVFLREPLRPSRAAWLRESVTVVQGIGLLVGKEKYIVREKGLVETRSDREDDSSSCRVFAFSPRCALAGYCKFGATGTGVGLTNKNFAKLAKESRLLDRKLTLTQLDLIFTKCAGRGNRKIGWPERGAAEFPSRHAS